MSMEQINAARAEIAATSAYKTITEFFDADSFCEIDAFAKSGEGFAEAVAGYGTVEGLPVYAFAQNSDISGGALSKAQTAKLRKLYALALKTGAPVVGFYDSVGGRLAQGTELLAGAGEVLTAFSRRDRQGRGRADKRKEWYRFLYREGQLRRGGKGERADDISSLQ